MKLIDADSICNKLLNIRLSDTVADSTRNLILAIIEQEDEVLAHCNIKENAEIIAKILDADSDKKIYGGRE